MIDSRETAILKVLYPPDGAVPANKLDSVNLMRSLIKSLITISENGIPLSAKPMGSRTISDSALSAEVNRLIVEMVDDLKANSQPVKWTVIGPKFNLSAEAAADRYRRAKRAMVATVEPVEAGAEEARMEAEAAKVAREEMNQVPIKKENRDVAPVVVPKKRKLSPIDQMILDLNEKNNLDIEIRDQVNRKFNENYTTMEIHRRIIKLRGQAA
jgi:hypothetical protein